MARSNRPWLSGQEPAESGQPQGYPGETLGLPERGPGSLARLGRRLAREQGRMAECFELMQQWHAAAEEEEDRAVLSESAREMVWILEGWGRTEEAERLEERRAIEFDEQMRLF